MQIVNHTLLDGLCLELERVVRAVLVESPREVGLIARSVRTKQRSASTARTNRLQTGHCKALPVRNFQPPFKTRGTKNVLTGGMRFAAVSICIASRTTSLQMPQSSALTCAAVTVNSCRPKPPTRWLCSGSSHRLVLAADSRALAGSVSSGGFIVLDMFAKMSVPATWFDGCKFAKMSTSSSI